MMSRGVRQAPEPRLVAQPGGDRRVELEAALLRERQGDGSHEGLADAARRQHGVA